uniref:Uncharacterized protein n=1 Tax=Tanacetum cinerariifolium TaxID=118510 RepID=A0A699HC58_TANCI|nr:hypothetical protein [Tanacetum cinerariifolium]
MKELQLDDKLNFVEEPVEIMDREVKQLKQSRLELSDAQQEHALTVESLAPRLAALKVELCPEKNSGSTTIYVDISLSDFDHFHFKSDLDPGELTSIVDSRICENVSSMTNVNLPFEDNQSPLFAYVVWIFLPFLTYPVAAPYLLSSGDEDIILDPSISIYHSFMSGVSHRSGTFMKFNVYPNHLNESPIEILSSTCVVIELKKHKMGLRARIEGWIALTQETQLKWPRAPRTTIKYYGVAGDDYEGAPVFDDNYEEAPVFDDDQFKEESMPVYDTDFEDAIEEEEEFARKGGFDVEEDNIEDVVVVANDLCSSMIQTSINVNFSKTVDSNPLE